MSPSRSQMSEEVEKQLRKASEGEWAQRLEALRTLSKKPDLSLQPALVHLCRSQHLGVPDTGNALGIVVLAALGAFKGVIPVAIASAIACGFLGLVLFIVLSALSNAIWHIDAEYSSLGIAIILATLPLMFWFWCRTIVLVADWQRLRSVLVLLPLLVSASVISAGIGFRFYDPEYGLVAIGLGLFAMTVCGGIAMQSLSQVIVGFGVDPGGEQDLDRALFIRMVARILCKIKDANLSANSHLICRTCQCRITVITDSDTRLKYIGCRRCRRVSDGQDVWKGIRQVVAVVDSARDSDCQAKGDTLRVNWFRRRLPFDFDRVEIVNANDEDIERFCVQIGNDTDDFRRNGYKGVPAGISPNCRLSENTMRILRSMLGEVSRV